MLFEIPEEDADKALLQCAVLIRVLDDSERLGDYLQQLEQPGFGQVVKPDGSTEPLYLRDLTNKVLHAATFEWDFSDYEKPAVICHPFDAERWKSARIDLASMAAFCAQLMS